jgi:hypothetical protein
MSLLCCRCGRRLLKSAFTSNASSGPAAYGKVCAMKLGLMTVPDLLQRRVRVKRSARSRRAEPDERQLSIPL